jgi:hypothetical protein
MRADLLKELAEDDEFTAALDELWPILTPETRLTRQILHRAHLGMPPELPPL